MLFVPIKFVNRIKLSNMLQLKSATQQKLHRITSAGNIIIQLYYKELIKICKVSPA